MQENMAYGQGKPFLKSIDHKANKYMTDRLLLSEEFMEKVRSLIKREEVSTMAKTYKGFTIKIHMTFLQTNKKKTKPQ